VGLDGWGGWAWLAALGLLAAGTVWVGLVVGLLAGWLGGG
jgi:hypothetical protein